MILIAEKDWKRSIIIVLLYKKTFSLTQHMTENYPFICHFFLPFIKPIWELFSDQYIKITLSFSQQMFTQFKSFQSYSEIKWHSGHMWIRTGMNASLSLLSQCFYAEWIIYNQKKWQVEFFLSNSLQWIFWSITVL